MSYDPNIWVRAYVPGFGIDSSGDPCFETEGAGGETVKVLLNAAQERIVLLTGAGAA